VPRWQLRNHRLHGGDRTLHREKGPRLAWGGKKPARRNRIRLAVLCDLREENWPSMDLVAEMLLAEVRADPSAGVRAMRICPRMTRRFSHLPIVGSRPGAFNLDRLLNRFWDYPRNLDSRKSLFDWFHVVDHSYAQLVHVLPPGRTGVFCHDLDTFQCLLEPQQERRPRWFQSMMRRVLKGFQKAAVVFHTTAEMRRRIEEYALVDPAKLVHVPLGVSPEFSPEPTDDDSVAEALAGLNGKSFLLHVGSCIQRKRIDVLLNLFAAVRGNMPELVLVQAGGQWTPTQHAQIERLELGGAIIQQRGLDRQALAMLYRRATLVVLPSEAEGFGLPVIEALACGTRVVASDIPVLREVGGSAVSFCPVADIQRWVDMVCRLLAEPAAAPPRESRLAQARQFSWARHAQTILEAYRRME
jgi:glycosyltransferase involved in cell wall biosynthesis